MPRPARSTIAGQVYNDLRNLAQREGSSTDQIMIEYVLERFLYRMSRSSLGGSSFVLKGGLLLAQFGARRATRDIDILGRLTPHDQTEISSRIANIARSDANDGVTFDPSALRISLIREESQHGGLRLTMPAAISGAQLKLQLGDAGGGRHHHLSQDRAVSSAPAGFVVAAFAPSPSWCSAKILSSIRSSWRCRAVRGASRFS